MNKDDFKHGDRITCYIEESYIEDAKISIDKKDNMFICQDECDGSNTNDKLGYKYSWNIYKTSNPESFEIQLVNDNNKVTQLKKFVELQKNQDDISTFEIDKESADLIKKGALRI
jgi:hypothetical protein